MPSERGRPELRRSALRRPAPFVGLASAGIVGAIAAIAWLRPTPRERARPSHATATPAAALPVELPAPRPTVAERLAPLATGVDAPNRAPASAPDTALPRANPAPATNGADERAARRDRLAAVLNAGDHDTARALARECLGADPTDIECHHTLLSSLSRYGEFGLELDQAIDDCLAFVPEDAHCLDTKVTSAVYAARVAETDELRAARLASAKAWLARRDALADSPPAFLSRAVVAEAEGNRPAACAAYGEACRGEQPFACRMVREKCTTADVTPPR